MKRRPQRQRQLLFWYAAYFCLINYYNMEAFNLPIKT